MKVHTLRAWLWVHSWSSVVSTIVILVLFVSGLPLIFKTELESMLGYGQSAAASAGGAEERVSLDAIAAAGMAASPGHVVHYMVWEKDLPNAVLLNMGKTPTSHFSENFNILINEGSGELAESRPSPLDFFLGLHTTLFMGPPGYTLMGVIALLFVIALISGLVVYGPHMRRLRFGDVRTGRSRRTRWLDFHNLIGVITLGWAFVVGGTGMINSWGEYVLLGWRSGQLADTVAEYADVPVPEPERFVSLDTVRAAALAEAPDKELYYIASPGSFMSSMHHYSVFMRGGTPRTEFILYPILVDALSGEVSATPALPGYITALMLCQPLHFGNYGGLPLKIIWALFDIATIVVLLSGLYLWWTRRSGGPGNSLKQEAP